MNPAHIAIELRQKYGFMSNYSTETIFQLFSNCNVKTLTDELVDFCLSQGIHFNVEQRRNWMRIQYSVFVARRSDGATARTEWGHSFVHQLLQALGSILLSERADKKAALGEETESLQGIRVM